MSRHNVTRSVLLGIVTIDPRHAPCYLRVMASRLHATVLLVALLSIVACTPDRCDTFDPAHGMAEGALPRAAWDAAAAEWCDRAGLCVATREGGGSRVQLGGIDRYLPTAAGYCYHKGDGTSEIGVADRFAEDVETMRLVYLHELGHHFGCKHSSSPADLMYHDSAYWYVEHLSEADLACADER